MFFKIFRTALLVIFAFAPMPFYFGYIYWLPVGLVIWVLTTLVQILVVIPICWIICDEVTEGLREVTALFIRAPCLMLKQIWG